MKLEIRYVDMHGVTPDGDRFEFTATRAAIKSGFMINLPMTLVFPTGHRFDTIEARVTPIGRAIMEKALSEEGSA